jgi:tetratricopeptide (TPR) repeat protein
MNTAALLFLLLAVGPPYYARPVDAAADRQQLLAEARSRTARPEYWSARLQLYLALGELQTIPELVELMAATFPGEPVFLEARMMFLSLERRHDEAIVLGERVLRDFPAYPTIRANLGRVYLAAGHRARGVNLLLSALEFGPIRVEDWKLLLQGLGLREEHPDAVVATLERKVDERPDVRGLRYMLMIALTRLGRYGEAREVLMRAPELADHPELRQFVDHVEESIPRTTGKP